MSDRVAVIGAEAVIAGWGLAGARLVPAEGTEQVHRAWAALDTDVGMVILTADAAASLTDVTVGSSGPLTVVLP